MSPASHGASSSPPIPRFALVSGDPPHRWQRRLGLLPRRGLGTPRRAVLLTLLSGLPIVLWALRSGSFWPGGSGAPLLQHYGVLVQCLLAPPLLLFGEELAERMVRRVVPQFLLSGVMPEAEIGRFGKILHGVTRLRDHPLPWALVLVLAFGLSLASGFGGVGPAWTRNPSGGMGFGGLWLVWVSRPLYLALLLAWLWRLLLMTVLCHRIANLDLALVPTHPDRAQGLGFLEEIPEGFAPFALALSAVFSAYWTHQLLHGGSTLSSLRLPFALFVSLTTVVLLAPLLAFTAKLTLARRGALRDYGALVARQGRLVHRRWIRGEAVGDDALERSLLEAPELGPVVDTSALYEAVRRSGRTPIGRIALLRVVVPLLLPPLGVIATQIPLRSVLMNIVQALL